MKTEEMFENVKKAWDENSDFHGIFIAIPKCKGDLTHAVIALKGSESELLGDAMIALGTVGITPTQIAHVALGVAVDDSAMGSLGKILDKTSNGDEEENDDESQEKACKDCKGSCDKSDKEKAIAELLNILFDD